MAERSFYRRFSTWGAIVGVLVSLWMILLPAALGDGFWFWFRLEDLIVDSKINGRPLPGFAGVGILWWLGVVALPPAGFALCWKVLRARQVGLDQELALARRRAERKAAMEASESLWAAVEAAERAGDPAGQVTALDAWIEHAHEVELTADLRADRIERLRQMARATADADAAVRLLEHARALSERRGGGAISTWAVMRPELWRYGLGLVAGFAGIPLLTLPVAFMMWALNIILGTVVLAIIIVVVVMIVMGG